MNRRSTLLLAAFCLAGAAFAKPAFLLNTSPDLPVTAFNLTFRVGSADDPKGSEGLAHLTATLMREGGVKAWGKLPARSRAEIEDFLFPLAASIGVSTQKEQTSFQVTSSAADAETVFGILAQMILAPAFTPEDFERLKAETLDALTKQFPREDQEELGKAVLDQAIWGKGHPYSHVVEGTVDGAKSLTVEKVQAFYKSLFTQKRLTVGITGVIPKALSARVKTVFNSLPAGKSDRAVIPPAPKADGIDLLLVKGPFESTGVHLGEAISVTRSSPDFPAMYLTSAAFGKHRSFVGRLMRVVREERGLNYGTYSYVEDFPSGGQLLTEPTQAARSRQAFTMWGRPTPLDNGCFLLRQMHHEVDSLAKEGLTAPEFELGKSHLVGFTPLLGTGLERRLGYAIDSVFHGIKGDYLLGLQGSIEKLSRETANATIKKYLHPSAMHVVVVTPEPEKFRDAILSDKCEIHYPAGITKPESVTKEDAKLAVAKLALTPERIRIVSSDDVFVK